MLIHKNKKLFTQKTIYDLFKKQFLNKKQVVRNEFQLISIFK